MVTVSKIEVHNGLSTLKCPVTGIDVFDSEESYSEDRQHSPYLRFFIDWIGGMSVAKAIDLPADQIQYLGKIHSLFEYNQDDEMSFDEKLEQILEILPKSALVLEIVEPPRGGGHDGDTCFVCFDFSPLPSNTVVSMISF